MKTLDRDPLAVALAGLGPGSARPPGAEVADYRYVWHIRTALPGRKGEACRVEHLSPTRVRVEFRDGVRATAHRSAVRLAAPRPAAGGLGGATRKGQGPR